MEIKKPPEPTSGTGAEAESPESIESQIKELLADERESFISSLSTIETYKIYQDLYNEGAIDNNALQLLNRRMKESIARRREDLIGEKIGRERSIQIGKLAGRYLEKETGEKFIY